MTKSGIGTNGETTTTTTTSNGSSSSGTNNNNTASGTITQNGVDQAEIPIWVADKKKWVTGISKKTTVNDLIHAILKQCQIPITDQQTASQYVLVEFETSSSSSSNEPNEPQQQVINSQKIIDGDSKVCIGYLTMNRFFLFSNA